MKNLVKFFGTQKHWVCVVVLALVFTGAVFAQESDNVSAAGIEKINAVTLDAFHLLRGLIAIDSDSDTGFFCIAAAYERLIFPSFNRFTFGAELDLYLGQIWDVSYLYFGLGVNSRYYPMSERMDKFFLGASLGFNVQSVDGKTKAEEGGFAGLYAALRAGYKLTILNSIFIEPSLSYTYSKTNILTFGMTPHNLGWQAALSLGFAF